MQNYYLLPITCFLPVSLFRKNCKICFINHNYKDNGDNDDVENYF
jgi:hypothetical protein